MGLRIVALIVGLGAIWDGFTTFMGVAGFFDLPVDAKINPTQFMFAFVVTMVIFGFVLGSHMIWNLKLDDIPTILLRYAWYCCVVIDFYTSWQGTRHFVFYDDTDNLSQLGGLLIITFLIIASSLLLSKLLLGKDVRGKPFLF